MDAEVVRRLKTLKEELQVKLDIAIESGDGDGNRDLENIRGGIQAINEAIHRVTAEEDPGGEDDFLVQALQRVISVRILGHTVDILTSREFLDMGKVGNPERAILIRNPLPFGKAREVVLEGIRGVTRLEGLNWFLERLRDRKRRNN